MSTKSTRSFCQKLVWQKNSGGSYKFVALINREQPAEMKHYKQVCKSIYRGQAAGYSLIHWFPALSTESNLLRINMRNRFTTRSTEGSLLRLNII